MNNINLYLIRYTITLFFIITIYIEFKKDKNDTIEILKKQQQIYDVFWRISKNLSLDFLL